MLAHHFGRAGLAGPACLYYERAGDRAAARSAYAEAVAHFDAALAQARQLAARGGPQPARTWVLLKHGPANSSSRASRVPKVEQVYQRAYDIAEGVGRRARAVQGSLGIVVLRQSEPQNRHGT